MSVRDVETPGGWSAHFKSLLGIPLIFSTVPVLSLIGAIPGVPWVAVGIAGLLAVAAQICYLVWSVRRLYRGEADHRQPLSKREKSVLLVASALMLALNALHLFQAHFR